MGRGGGHVSPASRLSSSAPLEKLQQRPPPTGPSQLIIFVGNKFFLESNLKPVCCIPSSFLVLLLLLAPRLEEDHASQAPPVNLGHRIADPLSLGPQQHPRGNSESSTSSGEDYCNSPSRKLPPWNPPGFSSERAPLLEPPNLELAGSRATFSGKLSLRGFCVCPILPSHPSDLARGSLKLRALNQAGLRILVQLCSHLLCDLRQVSSPLWAFFSSFTELRT